MNKIASIILLLAATFCNSYSQVGYTEGMQIKLGGTYDEIEPFERKDVSEYFKATLNENIKKPTIALTKVEMHVAYSEKDLMEYLKANISAEAKIGLSKGKAKYSSLKHRTVNKKKMNVVISAQRLWEPSLVENVIFTKQGKDVLAKCVEKDRLDILRESVGSHVVTSITRGARVDVVYSFSADSMEDLRKIEASFEASYSGIKAGGDFLKETNEKVSNFEYRVVAIQRGGEERKKTITELIKSKPGQLTELQKVVYDAISDINYADSTIISFGVMPIGTHPDIALNGGDKWDATNMRYKQMRKVLEDLHECYIKAENEGELAHYVYENKPKEDYLEGGRKSIEEFIEINKNDIRLILKRYEDVSQRTKRRESFSDPKNVVELQLENFECSKYFKQPFAKLQSWGTGAIKRGNGHDAGHSRFYLDFNLQIELVHPELIKKIVLYRNGVNVNHWDESQINKAVNNVLHWAKKNDSGSVWSHNGNHDTGLKRSHIRKWTTAESQIDYSIEIYTRDLLKHTVKLGNIANPNLITK